MTMSPETAVGPLAEAPADRPTRDFEQLTREWLAVAMRDGGIDENEMRIMRDAMEQITMKIKQQGGIARADVSAAQQQPGMSPMEQNATGAEDFGAGQGDPAGPENNPTPQGY